LFQASGLEVAVSFDASNLLPVSRNHRSQYPDREIILAADWDGGASVNIGLDKAKEAALAIGAKLALPLIPGGSRALSIDFNDIHQSHGPGAVCALIRAAFEPGKGGHNESR
jgi:putative DNA primase/helicase